MQKLVTVFIVTGLLFLLLPGTFLGVWNLIAISEHRAAHSLSTAWIQAHGQAQMFGWIGTFVVGIGFYSLSKMGKLAQFPVARGWVSWVLWTAGAAIHWISAVYEWHWPVLLVASAVSMLAGLVLFVTSLRQHQAPPAPRSDLPVVQPRGVEMWMRLVICSTAVFFICVSLNLAGAVDAALRGASPALTPAFETRLVLLTGWGFMVLAVWGFNARWLTVFAGFAEPSERTLKMALMLLVTALLMGVGGWAILCGVLLIAASASAIRGLRVFEPGVRPAKIQNIHSTFPLFIRLAYCWLLVAAVLALAAAFFDHNGGFTGASRHALTVGFLATMVFTVGPRILPAFCGMRTLFSARLMFYALAILNAGCLMRVFAEIPAYERQAGWAWWLLPVSAIAELTAVALFVLNIGATLVKPPAHLEPRSKKRIAQSGHSAPLFPPRGSV